MIKTGLIDWTQEAGISHPKIVRSRRSCEYTAMKVNCCWNRAQNAAEAMYRGIKARTCLRSTLVTRLERSIRVK